MDDRKIKKILRGKVRLLAKLAAQTDKEFDEDIIHQFRLEAKQLRSFLRLLNIYNKGKGLKLTKRFTRLYHAAGAIRDTQVELRDLNEKGLIMPAYIEKLCKILANRKKEYSKLYSKKIFHKLKDKYDAIAYKRMAPEAMEHLFDINMQQIGKIAEAGVYTDNNIHAARKLAKDIICMRKLADKEWKSACKAAAHTPYRQLETAAEAMGKYHDSRVQLEHLNAFSLKAVPAAEQKVISKVSTGEAKRLDKTKTAIIAQLQKLRQ